MKKVLVLMALVLTSCTKNNVSFDTLEDARKQVRDNVTVIAQAFRAENKLTELDLYIRGDSTQSNECPQGDGWASIDLINRSTNQKISLKCSTVSMSLGCMEDKDFKSKAFASEDGRCNTNIPFPVRKLVK